MLNLIKKGNSPYMMPDATALLYFPEVFSEPRDMYVTSMLHEIANDTKNENHTGFESINAYLGNVHIPPIKRLW